MKVIAFITDYAAVDRIIDHRGASKTVKQCHQSSPATEVQQGARQAPRLDACLAFRPHLL
jgi:hypothetical protein